MTAFKHNILHLQWTFNHTPSNDCILFCFALICLCITRQLLLIINTSPCRTQIIRKKRKEKKDNGSGGKACLFMKAQSLSFDRKHVCLRWGHVVSLGLQYAKMSSTDPKKLNYYHLNSKNTLEITRNCKLGCGNSARPMKHSLSIFSSLFLYLGVEKHGICHDNIFGAFSKWKFRLY